MQDEMSSRSRDPVTGAAPGTSFGSQSGPAVSTAPWGGRTEAEGATGTEAWRNIWQERGDIRLFGIGTGTLVALGSSIAAAWWAVRLRRERNRPISRLRRQARSTARVLGKRLVDAELAAPVGGGGAGSALLLAAVMLVRALRNRRRQASAFNLAAGPLREAMRAARDGRGEPMAGMRIRWGKLARVSAAELGAMRGGKLRVVMQGRTKTRELPPIPVELGLGGAISLAAAWFMLWRVLTGRGETRQEWHTAAAHREAMGTQ
jgi:hypothetical protein